MRDNGGQSVRKVDWLCDAPREEVPDLGDLLDGFSKVGKSWQ